MELLECVFLYKGHLLTGNDRPVLPPHTHTHTHTHTDRPHHTNKGHVGIGVFVLYRGVFFIQRLKCTGIIGIGTGSFVLYRGALYSECPYGRFHCAMYRANKVVALL